MATNGLGCLIMTAVIDPAFRERLLAQPAEVAGDFELTNDEQEALISIRVGSFTEFAARLHQWLEQRDPLHLGHLKSNGSSGNPDDELSPEFAEAEQLPPADPMAYPARGLLDSRPLSVEVSRSMQPQGAFGSWPARRTSIASCEPPIPHL
ncbi:MAG: Os1348 family NHLP clan protein [Anaerolineae bacterium]